MKKIISLFALTISFLTAFCQQVNVVGDTAIFNEEGIVLRATITPNSSGVWYWASTDQGLNLSSQHGNSLSVTPSDTGVFLFRAVFFDGLRSFWQGFKVTVAPCGTKLTLKDYENQTYRSKRYGSVCWMAQNLRSTRYADGDEIAFAHNYNDNNAFAEDYGRLYTYESALHVGTGDIVQGVCPNGWQIPMEAHLNAVINQNSNVYDYQIGDWLSNGATNAEGFYLYPAGFYNASTQRYENMYGETYLILNTPVTNNQIHVGQCSHNCPSWLINDVPVENGYSVRCVKTHPLIDTTRPAPRQLYTIQYIGNGAESGSMAPQTYIDHCNVTLTANTFSHSGNWQFTGWNTKMDGSGAAFADGAQFTITKDTILYAQWHTFCTGIPNSNELGTSQIDSVKDHEGNTYTVVQIGKQCWLKENMRCETSPKGYLTPGNDNTSYNKAYYYDYSNAKQLSLRERGYLYNWSGALDTNGTDTYIAASFVGRRGICPHGWHLPTDAEWTTMEQAVAPTASDINTTATGWQGSSTDLAASLSGGCAWDGNGGAEKSPNSYSNPNRNFSGFSALPAGNCYGSRFNYANEQAYFWSATSSHDRFAYYRYLYYSNPGVARASYFKYDGFSVRCVRDKAVPDGVCFTALEDNATVGMNTQGTAPTLVYSTDEGDTWTNWNFSNITLAHSGDKVYFKAGASGNNSFSQGFGRFIISKSYFTTTKQLKVSGNIMRLLSDTATVLVTGTNDNCFNDLFHNTTITDASELVLPATVLTAGCYQNLFNTCEQLTAIPALPATSLASSCYDAMFYHCTSLATAPTLPAMTLADYCYKNMFCHCYSLQTPPTLPATTLANGCYKQMFGNANITTAPALPATQLKPQCYSDLFKDCTNLCNAPELRADTLVDYCYFYMFRGCKKLSEVTMLATAGLEATDCLYAWLSDYSLVAGTDSSVTTRKLHVACGMTDAVKAKVPDIWQSCVQEPDTCSTVYFTAKADSIVNGSGKVAFTWKEGNQIMITTSIDTAYFNLHQGAGSSIGKFRGTMPSGSSTIQIQYPIQTVDLSEQNFTKLDSIPVHLLSLSAWDSTSNDSLTLSHNYAIARINLYGQSTTISKIQVTNTSSDEPVKPTYTLNIQPAVTLSETASNPTVFYVVVPKGEYKISTQIFDNTATPATICTFQANSNILFNSGTVVDIFNGQAKEVKSPE